MTRERGILKSMMRLLILDSLNEWDERYDAHGKRMFEKYVHLSVDLILPSSLDKMRLMPGKYTSSAKAITEAARYHPFSETMASTFNFVIPQATKRLTEEPYKSFSFQGF
jgi:hypothetical protein